MARAGMVLEAAAMLTGEPLPPARSLAEGVAGMIMMLLASLFRARHGLQGAAAEREGQMTQFAQWLEEYDVQVRRLAGSCTAAVDLTQVPCVHTNNNEPISSALKDMGQPTLALEGNL